MKKIKLHVALGIILIGISCTKQPYYHIPVDNNGNVAITDVSSATSNGITTLDSKFTVSAFFPNAKEGDTMTSELLKPQTPPGGGADQLLPLSNTQKQIVLGSDLQATVSYTREEAKMTAPGDFVRVTFSGRTASGQVEIKMEQATTVVGPEFDGNGIDLMRNAGDVFFDIDVQTNSGAYGGHVIAKMKNGNNASWINIGTGTFSLPARIPISSKDFQLGKDTMYYSFVVKNGEFADSITRTVVVQPPSFFFTHSGSLSLTNVALGGLNLLNDSAVKASDNHAILSISKNKGALILTAGTAWSEEGKSISFVSADQMVYDNNNSVAAMDTFDAGTSVLQVKPVEGEGIYIFKIVNGPDPADVLYGMIKITEVIPGKSVDLEYRIGNRYSQLAILN